MLPRTPEDSSDHVTNSKPKLICFSSHRLNCMLIENFLAIPRLLSFPKPSVQVSVLFQQGQRKFLSLSSTETLWDRDYSNTQLHYTHFELVKIIKSDIFWITWFDLHLCCRRFFSLRKRWLMHMYYLHGQAIVYIFKNLVYLRIPLLNWLSLCSVVNLQDQLVANGKLKTTSTKGQYILPELFRIHSRDFLLLHLLRGIKSRWR